MPKLLKSVKSKIIAVSAIILLFCLFLIMYFPVKANQIEVVIEKGQGLAEISQILRDGGVIRSRWLFMLYVRLTKEDRNLKAGTYIFDGATNMSKVVNVLTEGLSQPDDIEVLIHEGSNVWDIDQILANKGVIRLGEFSDKFYLKEGYLFPDTYRFLDPQKEKITIEAIGDKMFNNFDSKTKDVFKGLSLIQQREIIILASMLEKEAKIEQDMRMVAGIIRKRMELGMLLQIDATVTYGACLRQYNLSGKLCDVTLVGVANEIKIDGLYNSYIRKGLPPGPISNPGLKAIAAASDPKDSDYLYYLSTRDGSQIIYSKTADEHLRNRRKYLGF